MRSYLLRRDLAVFGRTRLVPSIAAVLAWAVIPARAQECVFPATPSPVVVTQPDGRTVALRFRGAPPEAWYEDESGLPVVKSGARYVYAHESADGALVATEHEVGLVAPRELGIAPRTTRAPAEHAHDRGAASKSTSSASAASSGMPAPQSAGARGAFLAGSGAVKNLVLLLRFSDHGPAGQNRTLPSAANVNTIMNAVGGDPVLAPTGSVRDHYLETSYGQFTINSTSVGWIDVPNTETYYANNNSGLTTRTWELITDGLDLADATTDFTQYDEDGDGWVDAITFLHSGYGAEWGGADQYGTDYSDRMWSHKWTIPTWTSAEGVKVGDYNISPGLWGTSGSGPGRIGVVCHELGHFFGLPDLYDTDGTSQGIGNWCLMAGGSWGFDSSQQRPSHPSAWAKIFLGWVTPQLLAPGTHSAPRVESTPTIFRIDYGYRPGESLLVENRQQFGFDSALPQGGLAVWHVDEAKGSLTQNSPNTDEGYPGQAGWPTNGRHFRIALLQADGGFDMEEDEDRGDSGDVYHAAGVSQITNATTPNTDAYQSGTIVSTGNRIQSIGASGANIGFTYSVTGGGSVPTNNTSSLPSGQLGVPYSFALSSSGGTAPRTWMEYRASPVYTLVDLGPQSYATGGTAQNWNADDNTWQLNLPFAFPFYERSYTRVQVSSNGFLAFHPTDAEAANRADWLRGSVRIAAMWDDLQTDLGGQNIFVDTTVTGRVRIRWVASSFDSGAPCNFAISLYSDGRIRFDYGSGNTGLTPTVGISRGHSADVVRPATHDGQATLTNASSLEFALGGSQIPAGLSLSSAGVLSGTPTAAGAFQPIFRVTDNIQRYDQDALALVIGSVDCNGNGVQDTLDISNGTSQDCNSNGVPDECETDTDGDGTPDACDGCPNDPAKTAPGVCGCGVADTDSDGDGTPNCNDGCPNDPAKTAPGVCGCGVADTDSDSDGTPDCNDGCPNDPEKTAPGICGCGVPDVDSDGDGVFDCDGDKCPLDPNKVAPGVCGCGVPDDDSDSDGVADCLDNCPLVDNPGQEDFDQDQLGDACDGIGAPFCFGDGSLATPCPCVPPNSVPFPSGGADAGCANSFDLNGAKLSVSGTTSPDTLAITVDVGPTYVGFAFLVKGNGHNAAGIAGGDGVRCVDGALIRFGGHFASTNGAANGQWTYPNTVQTTAISAATLQPAASTAYYQLFYRNAAAAFCSAGTTNFSNGYQVYWQ
ncbi:MAG: M6 family metalloprotease domain-containing protein [Planctomycetota bacterium]